MHGTRVLCVIRRRSNGDLRPLQIGIPGTSCASCAAAFWTTSHFFDHIDEIRFACTLVHPAVMTALAYQPNQANPALDERPLILAKSECLVKPAQTHRRQQAHTTSGPPFARCRQDTCNQRRSRAVAAP